MKSVRHTGLLLSLPPLLLLSTTAIADPYLVPTAGPLTLSDGTGAQFAAQHQAAKAKLVRLSNGGPTHGRLISVFADAWSDADHPDGHQVYDVKGDKARPARDIYVRYSDDDGRSWSEIQNLSRTAAMSSHTGQWQGEDRPALPFYGDSDKPNVFNSGTLVVISWVDKYCPGGAQGSVTYLERDQRVVPYSCLYTVRSSDGGAHWQPAQRLTDGERDAKQDSHRGNSTAWVLTWQEDPAGLALGEADGPGDGASGARTALGTDIWYSHLSTAIPEGGTLKDSPFAKGTAFAPPTRVSNNFTRWDTRNDTRPLESGQAAASRPNIALVGKTVVLAYEETKGTEGLDEGKVIRYHAFPFAAGPATAPDACLSDVGGSPIACAPDLPPNPTAVARLGCILSDPAQNARRVRMLPQSTPGPSGVKLAIFWRQGLYDAGGPADVMLRTSRDFLDLSQFHPPLNVPGEGAITGCRIRGDNDAELPAEQGAFANAPALNLSHNTPDGGDLSAHSDANPIEDALAHRGYLRGDTLVLGYSYTPDQVLARYTRDDHYQFWIRRSFDGGQSWDPARNLTAALIDAYVDAHPEMLQPSELTVREPRLVKTPGNGPATCPSGDPEDPSTTDPSECSNPRGFVVAGGLVENTYEHLGGGQELDLFLMRTQDGGDHFEPAFVFTSPIAEDFESQLRPTPALDQVFVVWNQRDDQGGTDAQFQAFHEAEVTSTTSDSGAGLWWLLWLPLLWRRRS
ncbi:sialidase family protein [Ferrimonas balearica]|uniref:sialidase family protein n=1 Tax=Ferrimonas balearica TaxID=44012 RepID=UPI001C99F6A9|nr:sialidase family protein [Ferrimonas balearica]MBY5991022.1 glycoside hydrolase [Ferrimonas balearica]